MSTKPTQTKTLSIKEVKTTKPSVVGSLLLPTRIAEGKFANVSSITHTNNTFVLDFASNLIGCDVPKIHSRIILTAEAMCDFLLAANDNFMKWSDDKNTKNKVTKPKK